MSLICILSKVIYITIDWPKYKALTCLKLCLMQHIKSVWFLIGIKDKGNQIWFNQFGQSF